MKMIYAFPVAMLLWACSDSTSGPENEGASSLAENQSQPSLSSGEIPRSSGNELGSSLFTSSSSEQTTSSSIAVSSSAIQYPVAPQAADWCAAAAENCGTMMDSRDNRTYKWTKIMGQTWMAENLKYTGAETGTRVGHCPGVVGADSTGDLESCEKFGRLYTWYELNKTTYLANEDPQGLCPDGWEVPGSSDWTALVVNLRTLNHLTWADGTAYLLKATNTGNNAWDNAAYNAGNPYQFSLLPPETGEYLLMWTNDENAIAYGQGESFHARSKESMTDMTHTKKESAYARCIKSL